MAEQQIFRHTLSNGMTLLAERMDHVRSATMYLLVPAGFTHDPADRPGTATVLSEMLIRGAGDRDSKELSLALDNLGTDRNESVGPFNIVLSAGTLARNLPAILDLYADVVRRPHLPDDELEPVQNLALEDILGLEDSPQEKVILELKSRYYPPPLNRNRYGTVEGIQALTPAAIRQYYGDRFRASGAILSVAGAVDWPALKVQAERLFGDWPGGATPEPAPVAHVPKSAHIQKDTQQTQIALAFPSAPFSDPDYYAARGAVGVLSGGMSARLFTEVREKRGLCYSVYASHDTVKDRGTVIGYSGTRTDRAQQTLDVMVGEFKRLKDGITTDEVDRVRAALKTSLVMQQESTSARAGSMASDWFYLNRVRTVEEVQAAIDGLTPAKILAHLERFPVRDLTVVTLGPDALTVPV
ncbi:M16 family metallopeptidase [Fimbriiglobus ruber]|uniref:Zinc protease n=1 Tax=Fimbriiglobus ruber TaxID=1908690 RepID=A0A225DXS9_9BACT|nr:pitrilysin family protein [Fimbriiglobus ruber]OWK46350.1 zinc protease [Fimbriiglobus ruber]